MAKENEKKTLLQRAQAVEKSLGKFLEEYVKELKAIDAEAIIGSNPIRHFNAKQLEKMNLKQLEVFNAIDQIVDIIDNHHRKSSALEKLTLTKMHNALNTYEISALKNNVKYVLHEVFSNSRDASEPLNKKFTAEELVNLKLG